MFQKGIQHLKLELKLVSINPKMKISPIYQSIMQFDNQAIPLGDPSNPQFEPTLAWLDHLRLVYQESEETETETETEEV